MTLNDLERRNSPSVFTHSIALLTNYFTMVEDTPIMSVNIVSRLPLLAIPTLQRGLSAIAELLGC